jgi:hypothetical protein
VTKILKRWAYVLLLDIYPAIKHKTNLFHRYLHNSPVLLLSSRLRFLAAPLHQRRQQLDDLVPRKSFLSRLHGRIHNIRSTSNICNSCSRASYRISSGLQIPLPHLLLSSE